MVGKLLRVMKSEKKNKRKKVYTYTYTKKRLKTRYLLHVQRIKNKKKKVYSGVQCENTRAFTDKTKLLRFLVTILEFRR